MGKRENEIKNNSREQGSPKSRDDSSEGWTSTRQSRGPVQEVNPNAGQSRGTIQRVNLWAKQGEGSSAEVTFVANS